MLLRALGSLSPMLPRIMSLRNIEALRAYRSGDHPLRDSNKVFQGKSPREVPKGNPQGTKLEECMRGTEQTKSLKNRGAEKAQEQRSLRSRGTWEPRSLGVE